MDPRQEASDEFEEDFEEEEEEEEEETWIEWFCSLKDHDFFAVVPEEFLRDHFEMTGIDASVPKGWYRLGLKRILDDLEEREWHQMTEEEKDRVDEAAEIVYGLAHARYIRTEHGLEQMREMLSRRAFGSCPRALCAGHPVLPAGQSDVPNQHSVKVYCCRCNDLYYPKRWTRVDGAYWGTSFAHLMLLKFPEIALPTSQENAQNIFVPRVYGYKLSNPLLKERLARRRQQLAENPYTARVAAAQGTT
eukprot:CAMPEP_0175953828 /NCGR_PEP_ID=MMETSP0108-20121206/31575_1 /TAXON_ID=195067 ORGANISM="Goniomonas pacifica, Strain CCMP1869" /NCGR_SAMPLE_ID=MMETSP0108 /ASSEMBLY_ACC=CAM_ASM_000204 /LENGTH=247 /DNA_ID=CAMNT_0017280447 /DNA_START=11 /DNA_END=754 /DNA_ORIENTATION=-